MLDITFPYKNGKFLLPYNLLKNTDLKAAEDNTRISVILKCLVKKLLDIVNNKLTIC